MLNHSLKITLAYILCNLLMLVSFDGHCKQICVCIGFCVIRASVKIVFVFLVQLLIINISILISRDSAFDICTCRCLLIAKKSIHCPLNLF